MQERVRGKPTPTYLHMDLVESVDVGAAIDVATPFAPRAREHDDDATMKAPQKPLAGLWLLDVPLAVDVASRERIVADAGPQH